jgi:cysteine-rich repeat protein
VIPGCVNCTNNGFCLQCDGSLNLTVSNGYCTCPQSGQFVGFNTNGSAICMTCNSICVTCSSWDICLSCISTYVWNTNNTCTPKCGDGIIVGNECEDNNTIAGDGCSPKCTVENGYYCYENITSGLSICIYLLPRDYTLISQTKDPSSNLIQFEFTVLPVISMSNIPNFTTCLIFSNPSVNLSTSLQFSTLNVTVAPPIAGIPIQPSSVNILVNS